MVKKWTLVFALVLAAGALAYVWGSPAVAVDSAAQVAVTQTPAPSVEEAALPLVAPLEQSFQPCQWGTYCRSRRDCGMAGYCDFSAGGPHSGLCGCY